MVLKPHEIRIFPTNKQAKMLEERGFGPTEGCPSGSCGKRCAVMHSNQPVFLPSRTRVLTYFD